MSSGKMHTLFRSLTVLLLSCCSLRGGAQEAPVIREIRIRPPQVEKTYREMIDANMNLEPGMPLDPATLSEDIKRLYKTEKFVDVQARAESREEGGLRLLLEFEMRPVLRHIRVEGNQRIKTKRIQREIEHDEGAVLDEKRLSKDAEKIRTLYRSKGYVDTRVTPVREELDDAGMQDVVMQIDESSRHKVRKVTFEGNSVVGDRKLRKTIKTRYKWLAHFFNAGFLDEAELQADRRRLSNLYADSGYLDFNIEDVEREYSDNKKWVRLHFELSEGSPYTVSDIRIEGNKKFGTQELLEQVPLEEGERFRRKDEQKGARAIAAKYQHEGYLDVRSNAQRDVAPKQHSVDVNYQIQEGVPATIREIHIQGNRVTQDRVIRRELGIYPGDLADRRKLDAAKKRLQNLGHFSSVEIIPLVTEAPDERDLRILVEETETGHLMLGGGFSTEDDLIGMFEVSQSNFALFNWPTFRGAGQKLRLRTEFGTERSNFVLSFVEPWLFHKRLSLSTDLYAREREYDEYTNQSLGATASLARSWRRRWRQSIGLRLEEVSLEDFTTTAPELRAEEGDYTHNALLLSLSRDTRDSFINPRRGARFGFNTELMTEAIGSYANLYRARLSLQRYFPVFAESAIKVGGEIATTDSFSSDPVAIIDRYFAGGASSLRGFKLRDVGPVTTNTGEPLGGNSLFLGTVELRTPVVEMVSARAFCDFGNVWEDTAAWSPSELNVSVGLGVELRLPIGPISLDYGIPVVTEQDDLDSNGRLHFNIGYTF